MTIRGQDTISLGPISVERFNSGMQKLTGEVHSTEVLLRIVRQNTTTSLRAGIQRENLKNRRKYINGRTPFERRVRTSPVASELTNSLPYLSNARPTGLMHDPGHAVKFPA